MNFSNNTYSFLTGFTLLCVAFSPAIYHVLSRIHANHDQQQLLSILEKIDNNSSINNVLSSPHGVSLLSILEKIDNNSEKINSGITHLLSSDRVVSRKIDQLSQLIESMSQEQDSLVEKQDSLVGKQDSLVDRLNFIHDQLITASSQGVQAHQQHFLLNVKNQTRARLAENQDSLEQMQPLISWLQEGPEETILFKIGNALVDAMPN